ncbi:unnamed protein product [Rotaria sordida]|uniref:F-box domain-containing protein n=1 Tax=Rotaria sordida TaxID=392033 RepID=A0A819ALG3_9BILA|nr:unnamed protein product [Rotaria sordida]CAF3783907.1 unnamed protein product [Rotaria sordida]
MQLESLSNEVFHDLFEFLDPIQLIHAFEGLNTRFDQLLFIYFRSYRLDFRSISKLNFHLMCEQYLPLIIDHISSLCLSDDDETPQLSEHLIPYNLTLDEFTHLKSLLLQKIHSSDIILNIITDCSYLSYLTHLKIIECHYTHDKNSKQLISNIWRLIKLTHCTLDIIFEYGLTFVGLSIISTSIKYLSIKNFIFSSIELNHLLKSTPYLQYLCITFFGESTNIELHRIHSVPLITNLKLHFNGSLNSLINILQSMPNLLYLTIETGTINLNGNQWKKILIDYIPKIKKFRFLMKILLFKHHNIEEQLEDFLNTFQTSFWLDEHQWFVRLDWPKHANKVFVIYTLPYCFNDTYVIYQNRWSKTTCPNVHDYNSYDRVTNVFYKGHIDNLIVFPVHYPNIRRLTLRLPFDNHFWSIIPTLDRLISLEVIETRENSRSESQLKDLLNRAPRLDFLSVDAMSFLLLAQSNITHDSLRRIQLKHYRTKTNRYMNVTQCSILADSLLGRQCEVLIIRIENRTIILDLINKMYNLRVLNCECQDDNWTNNSLLCSKDELVEWLRNSLPETYFISRYRSRLVRLWINRKIK